MTGKDILHLSARELAKKVSSKEISALEAADAYLDAADSREETINAFITRTSEFAREQARKVDARVISGEKLPLAGVPVAVKDNIAAKGIALTCASSVLEGFVSPYNSTVYERLSGSGAVLVGKTNMDEFAMGSSTENSAFGSSHNPLDLSRTPGGSSGGSAAAVCARESLISIGTDTGGSSRQPASFCGLVSIKPTYGLVSRYGVTEFASSLDTVCPMTRNVSDCALVLSEIAGKDPRDMTSHGTRRNYSDEIGMEISGMKACIPPQYSSLTGDAARSFDRAVNEAVKLGVEVEYLKKDDIISPEVLCDMYLVIVSAESSSCLARFDGIRYGKTGGGETYKEIMSNSRSMFGDEVNRRITAGIYALTSGYGGGYYSSVSALRKHLCVESDNIFAKYDFIMTPTTSDVAFRLGTEYHSSKEEYMKDIFLAYANLSGCPAVTVPSGGDGKLPFGLMLTGRRNSETKLFRAAYALESTLGHFVESEVDFVE